MAINEGGSTKNKEKTSTNKGGNSLAKNKEIDVAVIVRRGEKVLKGEVIASYRKPEFAEHDHSKLATKAGVPSISIGIFKGKELIGPPKVLF